MIDHAPAPPAGPAGTPGGLRARVLRAFGVVPAVLAFAALGGVAWLGHHAGWKMPKLAELTGTAGPKPAGWCDEHNVPEGVCVECRDGLMPRRKDFGWCDKHGVPECPVCHPDLAEVNGTPRLPKYDTAAALALQPRPRNEQECTLHLRRVQFADEDAVAKAGVETDVVQEQPLGEYVVANGEVTFDPNRVTRYSARVPGAVVRVFKQVGDPVKAGDVLALLDAAEVGKAKSEFQQALVSVRLRTGTAERLRVSSRTGAIPEQRLIEAESAVSEARVRLSAAEQALNNLGLPARAADFADVQDDQLAGRLRLLGLSDEVASALGKTTTGNLLPVTAASDGVVTARDAVAGEVVDPARVLLVVADPSRMWLTLHVRQEDARLLAVKQTVRLRADGVVGEFAAPVVWVSPAVDEKTRTVPVRVELANDDGRLRNNTFGTGRVVLREEPDAVVVPKAAVHWDGTCHVVFVRDRDYLKPGSFKVFHTRKVVPGAKDDRFTEVLGGVVPGEIVATKGSAALRAELLKGDLGEG